MNDYFKLLDVGFSHKQALAILNYVENSKPKVDMVDLLPFHSWLLTKWNQRREAQKKSKVRRKE